MRNQANPERRRSRTVVFHRKVQHTVFVIVLHIQCCPVGVWGHGCTAPAFRCPVFPVIVNENRLQL